MVNCKTHRKQNAGYSHTLNTTHHTLNTKHHTIKHHTAAIGQLCLFKTDAVAPSLEGLSARRLPCPRAGGLFHNWPAWPTPSQVYGGGGEGDEVHAEATAPPQACVRISPFGGEFEISPSFASLARRLGREQRTASGGRETANGGGAPPRAPGCGAGIDAARPEASQEITRGSRAVPR